eukprot:c14313_g2_i1 orf=251-1174(+)
MDRLGCSVNMVIWFFLGYCNFMQHNTSAYKTFIVGDEAGWVYPVLHPGVDYTRWAAGKQFSLGDHLIFNYPDKNHSVIMTRDYSVYSSCDSLNSNNKNYEVYGVAGVTTQSEVPLVETGVSYFFCSAYKGEHCRGGMRFSVNVGFQVSLPPNLPPSPPPPPRVQPPPQGLPPNMGAPPPPSFPRPPPRSPKVYPPNLPPPQSPRGFPPSLPLPPPPPHQTTRAPPSVETPPCPPGEEEPPPTPCCDCNDPNKPPATFCCDCNAPEWNTATSLRSRAVDVNFVLALAAAAAAATKVSLVGSTFGTQIA